MRHKNSLENSSIHHVEVKTREEVVWLDRTAFLFAVWKEYILAYGKASLHIRLDLSIRITHEKSDESNEGVRNSAVRFCLLYLVLSHTKERRVHCPCCTAITSA